MKRNFLFTLIMILPCGQLMAAVPALINYQGRLTNTGGTAVPDGNYSVIFTIYDAASGGNSKWTETQSVTTSSGLFAVSLGTVSPITDSVFNSTTRYLGVKVGADPELTPRAMLITVPYAFRAATVDGASGGQISGMVRIQGVNEGLRLQGPDVGPANSAWMSFQDAAGTSLGYVGDGSSGDQDMYLSSYLGDVHLYTPFGAALTATDSGAVGIGTTTPHPTRRLEVVASETAPTAVYGWSSAVGGEGVIGAASGATAVGIWGISNIGDAGYFSGDVEVVGWLAKSGGSFKIDHPLDPANKYLNHSFVESPDMKNIYDGIVTLDARGEALVQLPEWFGALNKDFRYQLTCVEGYAPVYIAEEVRDNRFRIAGGSPNLKVSWLITGIRQDAYANAHRISVEEMKPDIERGFYLTPEELGYPAEKQIDWARRPELMKQLQDTQPKDNANR